MNDMTGTRCIDITDESRKETLNNKGEDRRITVRFYYPGIEEEGKNKTEVLTEGKLKGFGKISDRTLYDQRVKLYDGLGIKGGPYPLVLFSHGYGCFAEQNSDLCSFLAEHGYIVASISHTYEASETVFEDGTVVPYDKSLTWKSFKPLIPAIIDLLRVSFMKRKSPEEALDIFDRHQLRYESFMTERVNEWAKDSSLTIRKIREMNDDPESFLYQRIDLSKGVGATGHSFGGAAAYALCLYEDEISCGVNMDGGLFGDFGEDVNHKPFLQILNKGNYNVVTRSILYHDAPVHFMIFKDMKHIGFTDFKFLTRKKSMVGTSDPVKTMDTINEVHLAFFDRYLKQGEKDDKTPLPVNMEALESYDIY